jgi:hypothetical protein
MYARIFMLLLENWYVGENPRKLEQHAVGERLTVLKKGNTCSLHWKFVFMIHLLQLYGALGF